MKSKLKKRTVEAIEPGQKDVILWDTEIPGFGCKVTPRGKRSYFLYYRTKDHRERRPSIGVHGAITSEQARRIADQWRSQVNEGGDPSAAKLEQRKAETLAEFAERYMTDYAPGKKKPSSIATDRINLHRHILPALGKLTVVAITRADVVRLLHSMKSTPGAANRTMALLSHMMNVAEKWGLRTDNTNPCRHVDKYPERKRRRFLSEAELAQLAQALSNVERTGMATWSAIAAIRLLVFTGARLSEILTLQWDHVDIDGQCLRLPDSKTGAKEIYLPPAALEVLSNLERQEGNPYVIVGKKPGSHLINLQKPWRRIRKMAALEDVRIHDIRHSFASMAVAGGLSLPMIGALLGHTQPATTQRYAHLAADPLKQAADLTGNRIAAAMTGARKVGEK
jgi:integrase